MKKAVIFDLDGTLLNTLEDLRESTNFTLEKFGYPKRSKDEIRNFVGNGVRKLIQRAFEKEDIEEELEVFKTHYGKNMYNHTAPYDGIIETLNDLKSMGVKTGVVSNKFDKAVKELCEKYFPNLIDIAIGQSSDIPKKPAPDGVFKALKFLNENENSAIYIGDSDVDIMTAKNSNLPCIGVTWGFRDKESLNGANFVINKPYDIINIIRSE